MNDVNPILAVLIFIGLLVITVVWIIFPFMVNNGLNRIQRLLAKQNEILGQITDRQNETNKALQWIVSNWGSRASEAETQRQNPNV
jgi:predicted PurR-regulated permease PerM